MSVQIPKISAVVCLEVPAFGPLLFLIYINNLPFSLKKAKVTMYADDTTASTLEDVNQTLNNELSRLKKWLLGNKLSLNILKTQALVVGSQPKN